MGATASPLDAAPSAARAPVAPNSQPADAATNVVLGLRAATNRNYAHAIDLYTRAIDTASLGRNDLAVAHHARAMALAAVESYDRALQDQAYAIALCPEGPRYRHDRGRLLLEVGQAALAVEDFTAAAQLRGDDSAHWGWRGMAMLSLGRYPEALRDFSQAIALPGQPAPFLAMRGLAYTMLSRFDEAGTDFQRAERSLPTAWGAYANGVLYERVGLAQMALDLYEEAQLRAADADDWRRIERQLQPYRTAAGRLAAAEREGRAPLRRIADDLSQLVGGESEETHPVPAPAPAALAPDESIDVPDPNIKHGLAPVASDDAPTRAEPPPANAPAGLDYSPTDEAPSMSRIDIISEIESAWLDASHPSRRRKRRRRKGASVAKESARPSAVAAAVESSAPEVVDRAIASIRTAARSAPPAADESPYQLGVHELMLDAETAPPDRASRAASFLGATGADADVYRLGAEHLAADDTRQLGAAADLVREIYLLTPAELVRDGHSDPAGWAARAQARRDLRAQRGT
jgi:tetratricopeptide (TPR) repeat protein